MAVDAGSLIALRLAILIKRKSGYRADTCAGAAADAYILIYCNWHVLINLIVIDPLPGSNPLFQTENALKGVPGFF